jgi:hypothetical protein
LVSTSKKIQDATEPDDLPFWWGATDWLDDSSSERAMPG